MEKYSDISNARYFYTNLDEVSPFQVMFVTIITFGLYLIEWFYRTNKTLLILDEDAPEKDRCFYVLFLIPGSWFFINYFTKVLDLRNIYVNITELVGWVFIAFLVLKYIFDLATSFSRVIETNKWISFLIFMIPIIGPGAIQMELNQLVQSINNKKRNKLFHSV